MVRHVIATTTISTFASCISIALLAACGNTTRESDTNVLDHGLVLVGPAESLRQHAEFVRKTWPDAYAVAVVHLTNDPDCSDEEAGDDTPEMIYCWVAASAQQLLAGSWTHLGQRGTADKADFRLHYWYTPGQARTWGIGDTLVTLLAPTHSLDTYSATAIFEATDEVVSHVRDAVR